MDAVLRGATVYAIVWALFRLAGKRTLSEATTFDFVMLLIVAETTQQALLGEDFSITNSALLISTLIGLDILLSLLKSRFPRIERIIDGAPLLIMRDGQPLEERMRKARIDRFDILQAARAAHGIERLDQVKHAVLEQSGGITVVPWRVSPEQ